MTVKTCAALLGLALLLGASSLPARAADAIPLQVQITDLRAIQTRTPGEEATDEVYLLVTGVAGGETVATRIPEGMVDGKIKTLPANAKLQPIAIKAPVTIWKGEIADGQFINLTVTLMQGNALTEDKQSQFIKAKSESDAKVEALAKKTLAQADVKPLLEKAQAQNQALVKAIKDTFGKDDDKLGGMFDVFILNQGGKLTKRITPVGLTSGVHYGTDLKVYSKIKYTRENVLVMEDGEWYEFQLEPINDDRSVVRVKMLETEYLKVEGEDKPMRNVSDYLADVRVLDHSSDPPTPLTWNLTGEHPGPSIIHDYWDFAE